MKPCRLDKVGEAADVTPCVGVRIETLQKAWERVGMEVTPCVGVRIETALVVATVASSALSHPAWVCGLKLVVDGEEITLKRSHPAWVCGLKHATCLVPP